VVVSQTGSPDDGTDPNGPDNNEFYIGLKPRSQWKIKDKDKLIEAMNDALVTLPGLTTNFSQPIKDNVDEALAGVKGELAIKLFGPDLFVLEAKAREIADLLRPIRGVADLDYDHLVGQPQLQIKVDRAATARYGILVQDVQDAIETATRGRVVTQIFEGERRFGLATRLSQDGDLLAHLRSLQVSAPDSARIPLTQLAKITESEGLAMILREGNVRRVAIKWSVRGRDMGGLVNEAMQKVNAAVKLPQGYQMVWSGRFEDQQRAIARLYIIIPLVLFIIFILLFSAFQSFGDALLIMLNLPFAIIGGTLSLYFWGTNFSISAAVGYIAVFGVSVLDGVVLVSFIRQALAEDLNLREAIVRGCEIRFRPIIVTAIVAIIGFLPAALSHGIGAEIQRPLARVVIGGLISATAMTLLVLPAIYELLARRQERRQPARAETS
jgi:cobalt-zinc-cadmium resistance protein CzcA